MQKMCGIEEKKGREKEEKKEGKIGNQIEKKKSPHTGFSFAQASFLGPIRNVLFRKKQFISTFVFMEDIVDE